MTKYNPEYVEQLAEELMKSAAITIAVRTIFGAIVGAGVGVFVGNAILGDTSIGFLIFGAIGGVLGYFNGKSAVLRIRAEAQLMLTQLQIERNTAGLRNIGKSKANAKPD